MTNLIPSVEIPYGDSTLTLTVGLAQTKAISRAFGGMIPAWKALSALDLTGFATIIKIGSTKEALLNSVIPVMTGVDEVEAKIYPNGLHVLSAPLDRYLNLLVDGGKEKEAAA